jgi:hypothetical protein
MPKSERAEHDLRKRKIFTTEALGIRNVIF